MKKRVDITIGGTVHPIDIDADIKWADLVEYIRGNEHVIDNLRERFPIKFPPESVNQKLLTELDDICGTDGLNKLILYIKQNGKDFFDAMKTHDEIENVVDGVTRGVTLAMEHLQKIKGNFDKPETQE
jgi:hypothetical protein